MSPTQLAGSVPLDSRLIYLLIVTYKILIKREDSEKQYPPPYANDYADINANWNR